MRKLLFPILLVFSMAIIIPSCDSRDEDGIMYKHIFPFFEKLISGGKKEASSKETKDYNAKLDVLRSACNSPGMANVTNFEEIRMLREYADFHEYMAQIRRPVYYLLLETYTKNSSGIRSFDTMFEDIVNYRFPGIVDRAKAQASSQSGDYEKMLVDMVIEEIKK